MDSYIIWTPTYPRLEGSTYLLYRAKCLLGKFAVKMLHVFERCLSQFRRTCSRFENVLLLLLLLCVIWWLRFDVCKWNTTQEDDGDCTTVVAAGTKTTAPYNKSQINQPHEANMYITHYRKTWRARVALYGRSRDARYKNDNEDDDDKSFDLLLPTPNQSSWKL